MQTTLEDDRVSADSSCAERSSGSFLVSLGVAFLNLMATIQVTWFYINRVPPHIKLYAYEQGQERIPFQYRMLMVYPMRWAHSSPAVNRLAHTLNALPGWFPNGVRAEGIVQAPIDLVSIAITGLVARRLYQASSRTGLLTAVVYPLTLVMFVGTYCILNMHLLRFIYDIPSLAFFAIGLYFIYFRHEAWFGMLFCIATINRETTFFLLLVFVLTQCVTATGFNLRKLYTFATLRVVVPLSVFWLGWHAYVVHRFAGNPSESLSRIYLNSALLLLPVAWPQIFGAFGYLWPLVLWFRRDISDPVLRAWLWVVPWWLLFMFYYGIYLEVRIFGELIPYFACVALLIWENRLMKWIGRRSEGYFHVV